MVAPERIVAPHTRFRGYPWAICNALATTFVSISYVMPSYANDTSCKNLPASITVMAMTRRIDREMLKLARKELASAGGKARAKKYDHETLSAWAKRGGRPRKATSERVNHISH